MNSHIFHFSQIIGSNGSVNQDLTLPFTGTLVQARWSASASVSAASTGSFSLYCELTRGSSNQNRGANVTVVDGPLLAIFQLYVVQGVANANYVASVNNNQQLAFRFGSGNVLRCNLIGATNCVFSSELLVDFIED